MYGKRLAVRLTHAIGLPEDVLFGLPRVHLTGDQELLIENHHGVLTVESHIVRVETKCGVVSIDGQGLILRSIGSDDVAVTGVIDAVRYQRAEEAS